MRLTLSILILILQLVVNAQSITWSNAFNVSELIGGAIYDVQEGFDREIVVTGELEDTSGSYYAAAIDSSGSLIWKAIADPEWYGKMTIKGGGAYYTVIQDENTTLTEGNMGVVKIDQQGNKIWTKKLYSPFRDVSRAAYFSEIENALFLVAHTGFYVSGGNLMSGEQEIIKLDANTDSIKQVLRLFSWNPYFTSGFPTSGINYNVINDTVLYCGGLASTNFTIYGELITSQSRPFIVLLDFKNGRVLSSTVMDGPSADCFQLDLFNDELVVSGYFNKSKSGNGTIMIGDTSISSSINTAYFTSIFGKDLFHLRSRLQSNELEDITNTIDYNDNYLLGYGVADLQYPLDTSISSEDAIVVKQDFQQSGNLELLTASTKYEDRIVGQIKWSDNSYLILIQAMYTLASPIITDTLVLDSQQVTVNNMDYVLAKVELDNPLMIPIEGSNQAVKVYPNPVGDFIMFSIPGIQNFDWIKIYGLDGQMQLELNNVTVNKKLDVSHLPKGIYLIDIMTETGRYHTKVVVM